MTEFKNNLQLPSDYAETVGLKYASSTSNAHKKDNGQFFTPKTIANFMGNFAQAKTGKISILDPGCGTAILSCSLIETLVKKRIVSEITLTLYETDEEIIKETEKVISFLKKWLFVQNIVFNVVIKKEDFILSNSAIFSTNTLFGNQAIEKYDYIITNPPYFKISKSDIRAQIANELVYGQPNIYSLFIGVAAKLLKPDGELIFITPRSFAAGSYFKAFRLSFFNEVHITDIHIFESRNKMFQNDNVLQENVIIRATKKESFQIKLSVSESEKDLDNTQETFFKTSDLVDLNSKDKILFIPSNLNETETINIFRNWQNSLNDYNIQISTGPVVAFRSTNFLITEFTAELNLVPLLWLHNIKEMECVFPLKKGTKASYILDTSDSRKVLLLNKNYILIRRFSTKDDKNRLICSPYFASSTNSERIGIENHLNYIYRPNGEMSEDEIWGISALFNSTLFDTYFRTFNGNTQVGAAELKQIKMPPLKEIILIGKRIKNVIQPQKQDIDQIINEILFEKIYAEDKRSTTDFARVGVA